MQLLKLSTNKFAVLHYHRDIIGLISDKRCCLSYHLYDNVLNYLHETKWNGVCHFRSNLSIWINIYLFFIVRCDLLIFISSTQRYHNLSGELEIFVPLKLIGNLTDKKFYITFVFLKSIWNSMSCSWNYNT